MSLQKPSNYFPKAISALKEANSRYLNQVPASLRDHTLKPELVHKVVEVLYAVIHTSCGFMMTQKMMSEMKLSLQYSDKGFKSFLVVDRSIVLPQFRTEWVEIEVTFDKPEVKLTKVNSGDYKTEVSLLFTEQYDLYEIHVLEIEKRGLPPKTFLTGIAYLSSEGVSLPRKPGLNVPLIFPVDTTVSIQSFLTTMINAMLSERIDVRDFVIPS